MKLRHLVGATGLLLGMAARAVCSPVFVGYYPSWKQGRMNDTDLSKYTHANIAFGLPHADGTIMMDFELQKIVEDVKSAGSSPVLSIGGWNGSGNFSAIMKNDASRTALLSNIVQTIDKHELDGVDIDWEFPGKEGNTKDFDAANDTPNYLVFLTELWKQIDEKFGSGNKLITMAVYALPFSVNGKPSDDVSAFAKVVDYASLMLYNFSGTWNKVTGPNAGLYTDDTAGQLSFATSINAWINAKWPANQLVAGVPFYGKAYTAMVDMTTDPSKMSQPLNLTLPPGDVDDVPDNKDKPVYSGMWQWKHLCKSIPIVRNVTAAGSITDEITFGTWHRYFDIASHTMWLFNTIDKTFITFDAPYTLQLKMRYAAAKGLAGAMVWTIDMDSGSELIDGLRAWYQSPLGAVHEVTGSLAPTAAPGSGNTAASAATTAVSSDTYSAGGNPVTVGSDDCDASAASGGAGSATSDAGANGNVATTAASETSTAGGTAKADYSDAGTPTSDVCSDDYSAVPVSSAVSPTGYSTANSSVTAATATVTVVSTVFVSCTGTSP